MTSFYIVPRGFEDQYERAMNAGWVLVRITNVLLYGLAGTGKTSIKHLILGEGPPAKRNSTPIREISIIKIQADESQWQTATADDLKSVVADTVSIFDSGIPNPPKELATGLKPISDAGNRNTDSTTRTIDIGPSESGDDSNEKKECFQCLSDTIHEIQALIPNLDQTTHQKLADSRWVYLMDSGGQPHFHNLLPLFVQHVSLAVYVLRLTDSLNEYPNVEYYEENQLEDSFVSHFAPIDNFKHLLQSIQSFSSSECRFMCIGTHEDKALSSDSVASKDSQLLQLVPSQFKDRQCIMDVANDHDQLIHSINAVETNKERRREMTDELHELILDCPTKELKVPVWWYTFELAVEKICNRDKKVKKVISLKLCKAIAGKLNFHEDALLMALNFFHENHIFHYYPSVLPEIVFCDNQALLDKVTELVKHAAYLRVTKRRVLRVGEWKKFKERGIFNLSFLKLKDFSKYYITGLFEPTHLVKIFQFLLIATPFDTTSEDPKYYMPSLLSTLPSSELRSIHTELTKGDHTPLLIQFQSSWYRCGVFCCLQVYLLKQCEWTLTSDRPHQNLVKMCLPEESCTVVLMDFMNFIAVHVVNEERSQVYAQIKNCILTGIQSACKSLHYEDTKLDLAFECTHTSPVQADYDEPPASKRYKPDHEHSHVAILQNKSLKCTQHANKIIPLENKHKKWISAVSPGYGLSCREYVCFAWKYWKLDELTDPSINGEGMIVAVIDTEVYSNHVTLQASKKCFDIKRFVARNDQISSLGDPGRNHGTAVAAVVCGLHIHPVTSDLCFSLPSNVSIEDVCKHDGTGNLPNGVAPNAKFLSLCVSITSKEQYNHEAVVKSLKHISEHNVQANEQERVRVVVMPFKLSFNDPEIEQLINTLQLKGTICVAAAGNDGLNDKPGYPALYENVLSVGSVDGYGNRSKFSTLHSSVDVLAPGENVLMPSNCLQSTTELALDSGTSFAAPAVAGLIALLLQCSIKYQSNPGIAWKHITNIKVLRKLFTDYMMVRHEQGSLLQPRKVVQFFNKHAQELDKIIPPLL